MTEPKALTWASPDNAWAIGAMILSFLIPVNSIVGWYDPIALRAIMPWLPDAWQWALVIAAAIALTAALLMKPARGDGNRMRSVLRVEAYSTALVALGHLGLWLALVVQYGFAAHPLTQLLIGMLGVSAAGRVIQITLELWRYTRSSKRGVTVHVEAVAQPKDA